MIYLSVSVAFLCCECDGVTDQSNQCQCGSTALLNIGKLLGTMTMAKGSYSSDYKEFPKFTIATGEA